MRYGFLVVALLVCPIAYAQTAPEATQDTYDANPGDTLRIAASGVLGNDSHPDGDSLTALLASNPSNGTLAFYSDGSFDYVPNAGFNGQDSFTYVAQVATPESFTIDPVQSGLTFAATLNTALGERSSSDSTSVHGRLTADVMPNGAPFSQIHLSDIYLVLADSVELEFDYALFGSLKVIADTSALDLMMERPGRSATLNGDAFDQPNNDLKVNGTVFLDAEGGLSLLIEDGFQNVTTTQNSPLAGTVSQNGLTLQLEIPVNVETALEIEGNTADITLTGQLVATADALPLTPSSPPVTVTLNVGQVGTSTDVPETLPGEVVLAQNYPNPFRTQTTIAYTLPQPDHVSLVVYDLLGRAVEVLIDGQQGAGQHEALFDARALPDGLYIYRLQAGTHVAMKKLVLLK